MTKGPASFFTDDMSHPLLATLEIIAMLCPFSGSKDDARLPMVIILQPFPTPRSLERGGPLKGDTPKHVKNETGL
jgi:hypothetical protein